MKNQTDLPVEPMDRSNVVRHNASANLIASIYSIVITFTVFPLYLKHLGGEAFGLVGFYGVLVGWMHLLDLGMSQMLSRQAAKACGQGRGFLGLKQILRSLELLFLGFTILAALGIAFSSGWIARRWLNTSELPEEVVAACIVIMGSMLGLSLFRSLYVSGIKGVERQVRANAANILFLSLRMPGAVLLMHFVTTSVLLFFLWQFTVTLLEVVVLMAMFYRLIPSERVAIRFFWSALRPELPFAISLGYTAAIWVFLTQLDKLVLSNLLPLAEYGYFALAVIVATGISNVALPILQASVPRMVALVSQARKAEMVALYRKTTQVTAVVIFPLVGMLAAYSREFLLVWCRQERAADWAAPILFWLALAAGLAVMSSFQHHMQYVHGTLRMSVTYNTIMAVIQAPVILWVVYRYGALGVVITSFLFRLFGLMVWTPIVLHVFAPGLYRTWITRDVLPQAACTAGLVWAAAEFGPSLDGMQRLPAIGMLIGMGLLVLGGNVLVSSSAREVVRDVLQSRPGQA